MENVKAVKTLGSIRPCEVRGCKADGLWKPVVSVQYDEGRKTAQAEIGLHICSNHRRSFGNEYFIQMVSPTITEKIRHSGFGPPASESFNLRWEKWYPGVIVLDS